MVKTSNVESFF